ncbi:MAG: hypothetical protein M1828_000244 [Chrysothrix sp. TS-e1954]|nr:MAG: hypothetical protein M1828_000244 [Chrysothrix sp. TS-e1954]
MADLKDLLYFIQGPDSTNSLGRHMRARVFIATGTLILQEKPIFSFRHDREATGPQIAAVLRRLSKKDRNIFNSLSHYGTRPLAVERFYTNAFQYTSSADERDGVFSDLSLINHSCLPNGMASWMPLENRRHRGVMQLYACADIQPNTEIRVSYIHQHDRTGWPTTATRRQDLMDTWGFNLELQVRLNFVAYSNFSTMLQQIMRLNSGWPRSIVPSLRKDSVVLSLDEGRTLPRHLNARLSQAYDYFADCYALLDGFGLQTTSRSKARDAERIIWGANSPLIHDDDQTLAETIATTHPVAFGEDHGISEV